MISFIVPAHNEEGVLGRTLEAIHESAKVVGEPYEIIVVDDASTDKTAEIARHYNARVVPVNHRQIAATRNSGGRAAIGERLFFIDADTIINPRAVSSALKYMDKGAVGGGALAVVNDKVPLYIRLISSLFPIVVLFAKLAGFTGGAFRFCTKKAFDACGGFDERFYWGEEGTLAMALKREGRFVVLWEKVVTSGRRFRTKSGLQVLAIVARTVLSPRKMLTQRSKVEKIWYDSNRTNDDKMPNSWRFKLSNAVALVILVIMLTGPLWGFIPWSLTPLISMVGKIRFIIAIFLCHIGLIFWLISIVLLGSLFRQKQWIEVIKLVILTGICFYEAVSASQGVIQIWSMFYHWAYLQV